MSDLVSVVIPVYNGVRFVGEAIASALAQSWPAVEVIVVDDGSDDGGATRRAVERFGPAVRFIAKPNGGVATALNAGLAAMRGRWFSWLSHDDLYHPRKLERYLAALAGHAAPAVAFGDVDLIDEAGRYLQLQEMTRGFSAGDGRWAVLEGRISGCATLIPRDCLVAVGGFDPSLPTVNDYAAWWALARRYPFIPVPESLVQVRLHDGQASRLRRHLDESSLLWAGMLEELEAAAAQPERLPLLRRAEKTQATRVYAGARAYVTSRVDALLAEVPVAVVTLEVGAASALERAGAAGARVVELVLLDSSNDAVRSLERDRRRWPLPATTVDVFNLDAPTLLRAAVAAAQAPLLVFLDPAALPDAATLREGLLAVAASETQGWLAGAPAVALPEPLSGAVLTRAAAAAAVADGHGPILAALARDASLVAAAAPPPPPRRAERVARPPRAELPTLLLFLHSGGGGTVRYATTLADRIAGRANVLYAWGVGERRLQVSWAGPYVVEADHDLAHGLDEPVAALRRLGVTRVDVLHSIGFDKHVDAFLDRLGVPFDVTLLDYHHVATHPHLLTTPWRRAGDAALADPGHPLRRPGPPRLLLRAAERRIACSRDLAARVTRLAPDLDVVAARLPEPPPIGPRVPLIPDFPDFPDDELRVLYLTRLAPHKGRELVTEVAARLAAARLPIRIFCLGEGHPPLDVALQTRDRVRLLGGYAQEDLNALICQLRPHLAWLPFTAPESHSFSLSDALAHGLPVLATGAGAVPERVFGRPLTWLLSPEEATPAAYVDWLERLRRERLSTPPRWLPVDHLPPLAPRFYEDDYLRPLLLGAF